MSRGSGRVEGGRPAHPRRGRQAGGAVASSRERRWGRKGVSRGSGAHREGSSSSFTGEAASRWRRGELALAGVTSLPALARAGS